MTRLMSMPYTTFFIVGSTWPENLISPMPSARPLPGEPSQPRKKPSSCHSASRPRQPGITGSPLKWQGKNQRSGRRSSTARTTPCRIRRRLPRFRKSGRTSASAATAVAGPREKARRARRPAGPRSRNWNDVPAFPPSPPPVRKALTYGTSGKAAPPLPLPPKSPRNTGGRVAAHARESIMISLATIFPGPIHGPQGAAMKQSRPATPDVFASGAPAVLPLKCRRFAAISTAARGTTSSRSFGKSAFARPGSAWRLAGFCSPRATGT